MIKEYSRRIISCGSPQHHCASVVCFNGYTYIAFYKGRECHDEQRVVIQQYNAAFNLVSEIELEEKTGNPVLFATKSAVYIIYSKFTDSYEDGNLIPGLQNPSVERWKYCRNYISVVFSVCSLDTVCTEEIPGTYGRLARISPFTVPDHFKTSGRENITHLIGFYREKDPVCEVWGRDPSAKTVGGSIVFLDRFCEMTEAMKTSKWNMSNLGVGVGIQPSFCIINNRLYAFCRNVARVAGDDRRAWLCASRGTSFDEWTDPVESCFPSHNNSLALFKADGLNWAIFSTDSQRSDMFLYNLEYGDSIDLRCPGFLTRQSYSYPNVYVDDRSSKVHIVHTNCGLIAWHCFDFDYLRSCIKQLSRPPKPGGTFQALSKKFSGDDLDDNIAKRLAKASSERSKDILGDVWQSPAYWRQV